MNGDSFRLKHSQRRISEDRPQQTSYYPIHESSEGASPSRTR
jgi:hypothetical protein